MSSKEYERKFSESLNLTKRSDRQLSDLKTTSSRTVSLEDAIKENLALEKHLESIATKDTAKNAIREISKESLKRLLSAKSAISTSSSFAERQQAAIGTDSPFREIGTGSIGKVFEHPGTIWAYKLPLTHDVSKLWNNYITNRRIENSFEQLGPLAGEVQIPRAIWYAKATTADFWDLNINRFPFIESLNLRLAALEKLPEPAASSCQQTSNPATATPQPPPQGILAHSARDSG